MLAVIIITTITIATQNFAGKLKKFKIDSLWLTDKSLRVDVCTMENRAYILTKKICTKQDQMWLYFKYAFSKAEASNKLQS